MRQYKGVETLLAATAQQDWLELTLVGRGPELAKYQRFAKRLSASVRFTGRLSEAELNAQYQADDIVVLPSVTRAEAFGLVAWRGWLADACRSHLTCPACATWPVQRAWWSGPGDAEALRDVFWQLACVPERLEQLEHASQQGHPGAQLGPLRGFV